MPEQPRHSDHGGYRILSDGRGWLLHLSAEAPEGWIVRGRNPNRLYLYLKDVYGLASRVADLTGGGRPEHKPWGMYEFSLSDPDGTLVLRFHTDAWDLSVDLKAGLAAIVGSMRAAAMRRSPATSPVWSASHIVK